MLQIVTNMKWKCGEHITRCSRNLNESETLGLWALSVRPGQLKTFTLPTARFVVYQSIVKLAY